MKWLISQEIEKVTDEAENLGFNKELPEEKNICPGKRQQTFAITNTKFDVPVVTLSIQETAKLTSTWCCTESTTAD